MNIKNLLRVGVLVSFLIQPSLVFAKSFDKNLNEIRSEINRDNIKEAINKLKKIKINNNSEQEQIDLLFGDIYLKINQPQKAEEFYQKVFYNKSRYRGNDLYGIS